MGDRFRPGGTAVSTRVFLLFFWQCKSNNMLHILQLFLALSILQCLWGSNAPAATAKKCRGWKKQVERDALASTRSRSPRHRKFAARAQLKAWAKGELSAVGMWRLCSALVKDDGTDAGLGVARLAQLGSHTSGSEKNCATKLGDEAATRRPD